ncbi:MAG: SIMPL domain-containing protein [Rikenellaceae bacterium]|jgi:uncharacterized protein YggE|nr:SIMPL domain-containing protein [Rikenellaceae bacterium]
MKKTMIALTLFLGVSTLSVAQQNVSIVENQNYIEVTGYNKAEIAPDEIYIAFQINEGDSRSRTSVATQERNMIRALQQLGIDVEKQLTVQDMSSNFKKYILRRTDIQVSRDYQLKVPDAQTAASVFAALEGVGIANASITKAEYSQIDSFVLDNKVLAMKNAQSKAARLAEAIGQTIGKAIYIQDYERTYRPYVMNTMSKSVSADLATEESVPSLEFEKISVESNVTVRFLLE